MGVATESNISLYTMNWIVELCRGRSVCPRVVKNVNRIGVCMYATGLVDQYSMPRSKGSFSAVWLVSFHRLMDRQTGNGNGNVGAI
jgi:hypothetical protein